MAKRRLYKDWSDRLTWSSLHGRVFAFTAGIVLLLLVTLAMLVNVVRRSQILWVAGAVRHTDVLARSLAGAYEDRADHRFALGDPGSRIAGKTPTSPVPGSSSPGENGPDWLRAITVQVLRDDEKGVEGGFYRRATQDLGGEAASIQEPGDARALTEPPVSTLLRLGAQAVHSGRIQRARSNGSSDVVVFAAYPVCDTRECEGGAVGAAWTTERLSGAASDQRRAVLWGGVGFSILALGVIALAYSVLANVERSTGAVLAQLEGMESDLAPTSTSDNPVLHLLEFQKMLDGVEHLGTALTQQMKTERTLQSKLRHGERLASIGRMAAGIAHELRSPLATVRFRAQMAQRAAEEATVKAHCEIVLAEVDRLNGIIERLLALSRPITLHRRSFDLAMLCEEVGDRWIVQLPEVSISSTCLAASPLLCDADESRIRQTLDNIVENAGHALREEATPDPWIRVECEERDGCAVVRVLDNGGGFPSEALQRGTEPFFTTRTNGTGLGLAVTHEIIEAHQGTLTIQNRDGEGAMVTFSLPLQPAFAEQAD